MNTTAAAAQANVTVATIRTWCRNGVIAAAKQAGRWIIDTASLAHRIAIAAWRKPMLPPTESMTGICAEWYIDPCDEIVIAVRDYRTNEHGEILAEFWRPELPTRGDLDAFNADESTTYLKARGWTLTGAWVEDFGIMHAHVTAN